MQYLKLVKAANHSPIGVVDSITSGEGGFNIYGWTFDPDDSSKSLEIHVYVGGANHNDPNLISAYGGIIANAEGADVNNVYGISGNHRFNTRIETTARGEQTIYIYAIDANDSSGNILIGSGIVNITEPVAKGYEMTEGSGQTIPDGDYIIVSELGRRIYLDIPDVEFPAPEGKEIAICEGSTLPDKSGILYFSSILAVGMLISIKMLLM